MVSGSSVYIASVENGHAIVRKFDQSGTGSTSLTAGTVRDLGDLQGGSVAGLAVNQDGSIVVAGSTHNGALDAGTVTQGYTDGKEGFIASLSADLQPSGSETLTYLGASTDQSISAVTAFATNRACSSTASSSTPWTSARRPMRRRTHANKAWG